MKRVKIKPRKPNALFEHWLEEWREEAASKNSDLQYHFSKALTSLRKYPLPLKSGKDCIILQHFGIKLCSMLDRKLEEYKAQNVGSNSKNFVCLPCNIDKQAIFKRKYKSQENILDVNSTCERTELTFFDNLNLPQWNVEDYAVLLLTYAKTQDPDFTGHIIESDLLCEVQKLCDDKSITLALNVFDCDLISMTDFPIRYNLTERGINISKKICELTDIDIKTINSLDVLNKIHASVKLLFASSSGPTRNSKNINKGNANTQTLEKCCTNTQKNGAHKSLRLYKSKSAGLINIEKHTEYSNPSTKPNSIFIEKLQEKEGSSEAAKNRAFNKLDNNKTNSTNVYLESRKFDIILLVDTQEISGGKTKPQHDATIMELAELGVLFEVRHLKVGDFAWIARCRTTNKELILPYIVERKRIDDLSASITDGRFHEQKFRLKQSGISNLMYIIEEYGKSQRLTIPHSSLMQASINTLMQDGFSVKYTKNHKESMFYLSSLTRILIKVFKDKNLVSCKKDAISQTDISSNTCSLMIFEEFNKASSKQKVFQVSQMFVRQLLQLKGLSVEKALVIVEHYPTPRLLIEAFQNCDSDPELLLANIQYGEKKRSIGTAISKTIYQLYTTKNFN